ncbi:glycosyltransferase family 1 protein [Runella rosea]|uniref:Glycosyltransferase family 1 protein n=1 Tax=Runella rosea TaxID=2259595 RepID=A0A344TIQ1_9BACT|nr:glycosyltransferase family 4 protein [Runella rosea]AXE18522.1 glycosyltransferase family 1 protein [Runella rosea]
MRICFVMPALPHYFKLLLNKLVIATDYEILMVKPAQKGKATGAAVKEETDNALFRILELEEYKTWYGKAFYRNLLPALEEFRPDIVVFTTWPYFLYLTLNPLFYRKLRKLGTKLIARDIPFNYAIWGHVKEFYFSDKFLNENFSSAKKTWKGFVLFWIASLIRRINLPLADAHINYIDEAREIIGSYGVPDNKIFVISNSPDTDELLAAFETVKNRPAILPPNPHRLIHVGRLVKWKRVDLIINAVQQLRPSYPNIELVVVGFGPELEPLKAQAQKMGLLQSVRFVGGVYNAVDLGQYLSESAVYVLGGMGGLSINDAMCFAKPIVCSVADGTEKRLVREDYNGYYFENGNEADLVRVLDRLLTDPEKVKTFGKRSFGIITDEINIHTAIEGYKKVFDFVANKNFPIGQTLTK